MCQSLRVSVASVCVALVYYGMTTNAQAGPVKKADAKQIAPDVEGRQTAHRPGISLQRLPAEHVPIDSHPPIAAAAVGVTCNLIDFEGIPDNTLVGTILGSPNVTFGPSWLGVIDFDDGGSGNFANEPTPITVASFLTPADPIDFDAGVQFVEVFYSASAVSLPVTLTAWDGPGGTGNVVDTVVGATVGSDADGALCTGDPNGNFCLWDILQLTAPANSIRSVTLSGAVANQFAFDSMTFCTGPGLGACCDEATGTCTDDVSQTACEINGFRFGGIGSDCTTIDPPCGCNPPCVNGTCTAPNICTCDPGCDDEVCCNAVCAVLPFCCSDFWDLDCILSAIGLCLGCPCDGDMDGDGDVDQCDLAIVGVCTNCPDTPVLPPSCNLPPNPPCDVNCDGTVDLQDFGDEQCLLFFPPAECCGLPHGACRNNTLFQGCLVVPEAFCAAFTGEYLGDGSTCPESQGDCNGNGIGDLCEDTQCMSDADCDDTNACTCDLCVCGVCVHQPVEFGDTNCNCSAPDLDDLLCVLACFADDTTCLSADIFPPCTGDGFCDLDDILAVLAAFAGENPCFDVCDAPCPQGACCDGLTCNVKTAAECLLGGDVFKGEGTVCPPLAPNPCP